MIEAIHFLLHQSRVLLILGYSLVFPREVAGDPPATDPPGQEPFENLEKALTHFVQTFEDSAGRWEEKVYPFITSFESTTRRWERMVYPAILVFGLLGLSGFWLIYSLTADVHELARNVDPKMERNLGMMSEHMADLSSYIKVMTTDIGEMKSNIAQLDASIQIMQEDMSAISAKLDTLPPLLLNIAEMNQSMKAMTMNTGVMSRDVGVMNQNVGRPMSFMNQFAPW